MSLDRLLHVGRGTPYESLDDVRFCEGPPEVGQDLRFRPHGEALAVHQDTVAVEDHQVEVAHPDETTDPSPQARVFTMVPLPPNLGSVPQVACDPRMIASERSVTIAPITMAATAKPLRPPARDLTRATRPSRTPMGATKFLQARYQVRALGRWPSRERRRLPWDRSVDRP